MGLALLAGTALFAACRETPLPADVLVTFSIQGGATRSTDTDTDDESAVDGWTLLLFRDGQLIDAGSSASDASISRTLQKGTYAAFAVVNPPSDFRAGDYATLQELSDGVSGLGDNAPGRFVMAGSKDVTVPSADGGPQTIGVDRLVCKAGIRKISVDFTDPLLVSRTFLLKAVYLTNVYGQSRYGSDLGEGELQSLASRWYNRMGHQSGTDAEALLADTDIGQAVSASAPYGTAHYFYCYPNPLSESKDSRSADWSVRRTRLVIEAGIGDKTYYYPITLPASQRNRTYIVEEAVIRNLGSEDPEQEVPGSIDVTFSTSAEDWNPVYDVEENS